LTAMKKVYIIADMPGCSGIRIAEQARWGSFPWRESRAFLAGDVNAAVEGAASAGIDEVVVLDAHTERGYSLPVELLDRRAICEPPNRDELLPGLDEDFMGVFIVGAHAMAGAQNAFLSHTVNHETWFRYKLAGRECGEIGMWGVYAGHYDVPVLLLTGDAAACREAEETIPGVELAAVKEAVAWDRARTVHPAEGAERIRAAAAAAVARAGKIEPCLIDMPNEAELEYNRTDSAEAAAALAGAERVGPRTVRRALESALDVREGF